MSSGEHRRALGRALRRLIGRRPPEKVEAAFFIVVLLTVSAVVLWDARGRAVGDVRSTATNLVALLHEQTTAAFRMTDFALRAAKLRLEREPIAQNDPEFRAGLTAMRADLDYFRALFVIGPDGFIQHDTDYPDTPRVKLADRTYFTEHRDNPDLSTFVGKPLLSRSVHRWFVPLARRIDHADGSFAGVVVAAIEPLFFERTYRRLQLNDEDAVALFHADGTLIARVPPQPQMHGRVMSDLPLFVAALPQEPSGVFQAPNRFTGRSAIIAYQKMEDFPLIVTVVLDRTEALAGWRRFVWAVVLANFLVGALILLLYSVVARRRLERQIASQKALAAEKLKAVGLMTSSVAHDFGNVLSATAAGIYLLRKRGPEETLLSGIEEAIENGKTLIRSMLHFAKDQEIEKQLCNPNQRIRELEVLLRRTVPPGIQMRFQLSPETDSFVVSPAAFDASLVNLVINAAHAMPKGGELSILTGNRSVTDGSLRQGDYVSVLVADNGSGIPPQTLEQIFEPFFSTKGESGTGLGLFQVRAFAREAGGGITVTSRVGGGTEVEMLIPAASPGAGSIEATVP